MVSKVNNENSPNTYGGFQWFIQMSLLLKIFNPCRTENLCSLFNGNFWVNIIYICIGEIQQTAIGTFYGVDKRDLKLYWVSVVWLQAMLWQDRTKLDRTLSLSSQTSTVRSPTIMPTERSGSADRSLWSVRTIQFKIFYWDSIKYSQQRDWTTVFTLYRSFPCVNNAVVCSACMEIVQRSMRCHWNSTSTVLCSSLSS